MTAFALKASANDGLSFSQAGIVEAVGTVWQTMLGLKLVAASDGSATAAAIGDPVTGCVQLISPTARGGVLLELPRALAGECAAILFDMSTDDLEDEDVLDVVGELTNMVAGSLTRTVASSASLTTPIIFSGTSDAVAMPKSETLHQVYLTCQGHPVGVRVVRESTSVGGAR